MLIKRPSRYSIPLEIPSKPAIILSTVDLPHPEGPTKTMNSPSNAVSRRTYAPGMLKVAVVSMPVELKVTTPGPLTCIQPVVRPPGGLGKPSSITVPAGSEVTIVLENEDVDIPHNVVVYVDRDAPLFVGTIVKGPGRTTDTFTAPSEPGKYVLGCCMPSTHRMGTFVVE